MNQLNKTPDKSGLLRTVFSIVVLATLSACATGQAPVVEKLDELTAVTYTYVRTPLILSPDTPLDRTQARDYVQVGVIEVNRMGSLKYYLWLGISDTEHVGSSDSHHGGFKSIVLTLGDQKLPLDIHGWTHEAIGVSEPVYKKLFSTSIDAYYEVTLEHVRLLAEVDSMKLLTSGSAPKEFVSWYRQTAAEEELAEFLRTVLR